MTSHAPSTQQSLPPTRDHLWLPLSLSPCKASVPAKPQSPEPSFLHSQLLKAGSKAGIASFQVDFQGQGLWLEHSLPSKWSRQKGTSCDSPRRTFFCPLYCPHACQGGTLPASLLPAPCHCQPSQCYCHRAPTPCCVFTHSCMEVSVMRSHCGLFGQSLLYLENKNTSLSTPGSIYLELEVVRGKYAIPKLYCKHTCSCTYLYHMPVNA